MTYTLKGMTGDWEIVVGMEIHCQVISQAKLFSGAPTAFGSEPNHNVALVDAAMPGMLPVINKECVRQAVRTGLAMGCEINTISEFARKNYFYADLPQGYQISQFDKPIVGRGKITIDLEDGTKKDIGVERLHLEQDAGKSIHDQHPNKSYIDLNRTGVALMEIVSDPDIRSPEEASAYLTKMRSIVRAIGSCDGAMAEGSMRADVNISIRRNSDEPYGTRAELKNLNSMRFIRQAIEIEARRQIDVVESGGEVDQETRLFDPDKGETRSLRSKEDAHDYRYFPDPDLLPLEFDDAFVEDCRKSLPELPDAKRDRFVSDYGVTEYDAGVLTAESETAEYFEKAVDTGGDAKTVCNWITGELFGRLKKDDMELSDCKIEATDLGALVALIKDGTISGKIAKEVFSDMFETGKKPADIVEAKGLKQISDTGEIESIIDAVLADNPDQVAKAKENPKLAGWFVGQVMQKTGGQANPAMVNQILAKKLNG